jgi:hypothetical protein
MGCTFVGALLVSLPYYLWRRKYPNRARRYMRHVWYAFAIDIGLVVLVMLLMAVRSLGGASSGVEEGLKSDPNSVTGVAEQRFIEECSTGCEADPVLRGRYCKCALRFLQRTGRMAELEATGNDPDSPLSELQLDLIANCGTEMLNTTFRQGCLDECRHEPSASRPECAAWCQCILRELRRRGSREASTRFMMKHLGQNITPLGRARLDQARRACEAATAKR